jgi:DNA-binding MurR/RpiR family transcriptional regulator
MKDLHKIISTAKLTKVGKIIGDYILSHTTEACFMTSTQLALELQVSEASIIRFSRAIGFTGYMDFQKYLQKCHLDTITKISSQIILPSERFAETQKPHPGELHYAVEALKIADASLRSVFTLNGNELFDDAIELILQSKKKYIASSRSNICLGSRMYFILKQILPDVYTTGLNTGTTIDHMCDISKEDCLILLSFPRYSVIDEVAMQMARDSGAAVILITDSDNQKLPALADKTFHIDIGSNAFFSSHIGINFLIELIGNGISRKIGTALEERLHIVEQYVSRFELI